MKTRKIVRREILAILIVALLVPMNGAFGAATYGAAPKQSTISHLKTKSSSSRKGHKKTKSKGKKHGKSKIHAPKFKKGKKSHGHQKQLNAPKNRIAAPLPQNKSKLTK